MGQEVDQVNAFVIDMRVEFMESGTSIHQRQIVTECRFLRGCVVCCAVGVVVSVLVGWGVLVWV